MFGYRPTSTHCFDMVKAMTCGVIGGLIVCVAAGLPIPKVSWFTAATGISLSVYIMLFDEERWQHAGRMTRLVRYIVFRPLRFIQFCWWMVRWACHGVKPLVIPPDGEFTGFAFTRLGTLEHFWTISRSMANYDMQHWFTVQECRDELKAKHEITTQASAN